MKIYIIWFIGVILWNFGYPQARPVVDVLAAIILSFISFALKKLKNYLDNFFMNISGNLFGCPFLFTAAKRISASTKFFFFNLIV